MKSTSRVLLAFTVTTAAVAALSAPRSAEAKPPFAAKEGKPCTFCHVGPPKRNYRGDYYKAHNLTFAGFDDAAEAKKAGVDVAPDPDPTKKPTSWTAPAGEAPKETPKEGEKPTAPAEEKKMTVAEAQAKVKTAETAYKAKPKDAELKKAYAGALADLAHVTMLDQTILPNKRYPSALKLDNQALKLDPENKTALEDKKAIEDAYKSMGRPIPK